MTLLRQAIRDDADAGIRETAEFIGPQGTSVFGYSHLPSSRTHGGVVVCSPIHAEFIRNYRREVLIGRGLAAAGVAVQRFHYRGHGNSGGQLEDATFDTMVEDSILAAEHLREKTKVTRIAFFGTRFGAIIAAAAARRFGPSPMVLWDPVSDPVQYFRDIVRAHQIQTLKSRSRGGTAEDLFDVLERSGSIDILGYVITRSLYMSAQSHSLEEETGTEPKPMLVVRRGQDSRGHRGLSDLVDRWRTRGFDVESLSIGRTEAWWFTAGALLAKEALTEPVDVSVEWLIRSLVRSEVDA